MSDESRRRVPASSLVPHPSSLVPLRSIILIGFMGSGKSSVARRLARRLKWEAVDLDQSIERAAGRRIAEIFAGDGEDAFRALETAALREALQTPSVIATGGGIVTRPENRELLREASEQGALVVYLRATPQRLVERIRRQPGKRPLIDGDALLNEVDTRKRVEHLLADRARFYESCADVIVDTDALRPDEVAEAIQRLYKREGHRRWVIGTATQVMDSDELKRFLKDSK